MEKLEILERYAGMFTTAMKTKFSGGLVFVDLMAGPGLCVDTRTAGRPEFPGSTLRALETRYPFRQVVAIETNETCFAALRTRVNGHARADLCRLIPGDCNLSSTVEEVRSITRSTLTLMFVDLLGTEVHMATLRALTEHRSVDLLITWPEMDVVRNRGQMLDQGDRWDAFFGTDSWRTIAVSVGPARILRNLQRLYTTQLAGIGYRSVFVGSVKNRRGRALYRPLFASRHALGLKFWMTASLTQRQLGLFD